MCKFMFIAHKYILGEQCMVLMQFFTFHHVIFLAPLKVFIIHLAKSLEFKFASDFKMYLNVYLVLYQ